MPRKTMPPADLLPLRDAIQAVLQEASGNTSNYAKTYARNCDQALQAYGLRGLQVQLLYVISNLQGWRGERARSVKASLRWWSKVPLDDLGAAWGDY